MWPYFTLVLIILLLQFSMGRYRDSRVRYFVMVLILFFFAALRGNGDGDYFVYLTRGDDIKTFYDVFHNNIGMELGYCILAYITNIMKLPKQFIIIAMNLISILCISHFFKKYSPIWCLSILVFLPLYFQFDMHAARTAVAISISTLGVQYALEKKNILFVGTILLAMLFHNSAVIALGIIFLTGMNIPGFIGGLGIIFSIMLEKIIGMDNLILKVLSLLDLSSFYDRVNIYINSEQYGYGLSIFDPRIGLAIIIYFAVKIIIKKPTKIENLMANCSLANAIILILFSRHTFIAYRLAAFYNIYMTISIPMLIAGIMQNRGEKNLSLCSKKGIQFFTISFCGLYSAAYVISCFYKTGILYKIFLVN